MGQLMSASTSIAIVRQRRMHALGGLPCRHCGQIKPAHCSVVTADLCQRFTSLCFLRVLQAREVADTAVGLLQQHNRRTLDAIGARIYFYYSWAYECTGALADVRR
jgi:hypothetical protein